MQLPVVSVGYLAAGRLAQRLRVHSRFRHAMNFMAADGHLLTLLDACRYPNLPDAVRLQLPHGWDWREMTGAMDGLEKAVIWQPERALAQTGEHPAHHAALAEALQKQPVESALMLLPGGDSTKRQPLLSAQSSAQALTAQVAQLIGFGHGLTPDGDDYLLGYLAALWRWQDTPRIAGHFRLMREIITGQLNRTNDISAHYLGRAAHGHFSEPVCDLMMLLTQQASNGQIQTAARNVMQFGASSGADCLAGMLHGIRTIQTAL